MISRTWVPSAPQAITATVGVGVAATMGVGVAATATVAALRALLRELELIDERVGEVAAVGELDIPHLLLQRQGPGPLADREQRHLRAFAGHVPRADHPGRGHPRDQADAD